MKQERIIPRAALALLLAAFSALLSHAADNKTLCVVVHEELSSTAFALETRPIVSFLDADVKLECGDVAVLYPLDNYLKITIEEASLPVGIHDTPHDTSFSVSDHAVTAYGVSRLAIYTVDGKCVAKAEADADGVVSLSTDRLRKGVYVVSCDNKSFKISNNK